MMIKRNAKIGLRVAAVLLILGIIGIQFGANKNVVSASASAPYPSSVGFYTDATSDSVNWSGNFATSWGANRLDVFTLPTVSNNLVSTNHLWYDGSWQPWESLPLGEKIYSWPAAVSWGDGRIDVFARGHGGNALVHAFSDANGWHKWEDLAGCISGAPAVSSWGVNRLDVFVRGCNDNGANLNWHRFDGTDHPWEALPNSQQITSSPAAVSWGSNRIDIFARDAAGGIIHRFYDANGWQNWE
jgi:hypothetical protein